MAPLTTTYPTSKRLREGTLAVPSSSERLWDDAAHESGRPQRYVWLLGLANAGLWMWWTILAEQWGMMPLNLFAAVIAVRNHQLWNSK